MKLLKSIITAGVTIWLLLISLRPAHAQTTLFTDDFSNGFTKWQPTRDNGAMWSIVNGKAEAYVATGFTITELVPKDAYWNSAWGNIEYQVEFTPLEGADKNISFAIEDKLNWYEIHFAGGFVNLVRVKNGSVVLDVFESYLPANGQTYLIQIKLLDGSIKVLVNGQTIIDKVDYTFNYNYGKIGLKAGTGSVKPTRVQFDNVVVKSLTLDPSLSMTFFKQTDLLWKDHEYDHATTWSSNPTIYRWGCALTSLAMIFDYHGLKNLPDGSVLNPDTLNSWLLSQPDGYVGNGLVNWLAGTRLTRLISEKYGTPKLEYSRVSGSSLATAINEITSKKPVILEILGHFLVGAGVNQDQTDLYVKDPAFDFQTLSQHQKSLLSTRVFQPSFTDLSYLLFVSEPEVSINLTDASGNTLGNVETFHEHLDDLIDGSGESTPEKTITQLAKPLAGNYLLEVSQPTLAPFSVEILTYDDQANPTVLHQAGVVGPEPLKFEINYQKQAESQIKKTMSFALIRNDLSMLKTSKDLTKSYIYTKLDRVALMGESAAPADQPRYLKQLQSYVQTYQSAFTAVGLKYIRQQLTSLEDTM